ncbi:uncharacterized protein ColSpa_09140 [Colletotrichum spaethianum]|uniref:Uncharacterized protein n=1 Tax=Colletotrichum spaethianum TaxID=700344 RepID=A0AA37UJ16_9PEZI|nr:uncharacterized protein ColSpa_09140 [Colletotrichum spaethianum]GKT48959.1 hypothetical protein ColSpa_09140 [Colletotrichum spaethianum]
MANSPAARRLSPSLLSLPSRKQSQNPVVLDGDFSTKQQLNNSVNAVQGFYQALAKWETKKTNEQETIHLF